MAKVDVAVAEDVELKEPSFKQSLKDSWSSKCDPETELTEAIDLAKSAASKACFYGESTAIVDIPKRTLSSKELAAQIKKQLDLDVFIMAEGPNLLHLRVFGWAE